MAFFWPSFSADDGEIKLAAGLPFHILCRFRPVLLDFAQGILGFGHFFSIGEGPAHVAVEHDGDVAGGEPELFRIDAVFASQPVQLVHVPVALHGGVVELDIQDLLFSLVDVHHGHLQVVVLGALKLIEL